MIMGMASLEDRLFPGKAIRSSLAADKDREATKKKMVTTGETEKVAEATSRKKQAETSVQLERRATHMTETWA